ncbi:hypothetical protein ACA910_019129 [Epithemia clementina (nom. ined.)]
MIPLDVVLDAPYLVASLYELFGIQAQFVATPPPSSSSSSSNNAQPQYTTNMSCHGSMSSKMKLEPANVVRTIVDLFRPSQQHLQPLIHSILNRLAMGDDDNNNNNNNKNRTPPRDIGVCLYAHMHDHDWHHHCQTATTRGGGHGNNNNSVNRGNCDTEPGQSLLQSIQSRLLHPQRSYIYTCGDAKPDIMASSEQQQQIRIHSLSTTDIMHKNNVTRMTSRQDLFSRALLGDGWEKLQNVVVPVTNAREFWAMVDFFVCKSLPIFIGHSISNFAALQIALRYNSHDSNNEPQQPQQEQRKLPLVLQQQQQRPHPPQRAAYWYNAQSIPLQRLWRGAGGGGNDNDKNNNYYVYPVPIVFTYTELSAVAGKHMLQTSIESVRFHMPHNPIHILYHGNKDVPFRQWLTTPSRGVILHQHRDPPWQEKMEEMRKNGDPTKSHLFLHAGNYFGTWQRIDIPLYLETEYALLLDADTVLCQPFDLADFGDNMTYALAMSAEGDQESQTPLNAGVALLNIPHLRRTYAPFLDYILNHVSDGGRFSAPLELQEKYPKPLPSDQGAYLLFYDSHIRFLSHNFNMKPYWIQHDSSSSAPAIAAPESNMYDHHNNKTFIIHFHGPKPADYIATLMAQKVDKGKQFKALIQLAIVTPRSMLCRSLTAFARSSLAVDRTAYCQDSFPQSPPQMVFCQKLMEHLALLVSSRNKNNHNRSCDNFPFVIQDALNSVPRHLKLPRKEILKRIGLLERKKATTNSRKNRGFLADFLDRRYIPLVLFLGIVVGCSLLWVVVGRSWLPRPQQCKRCNMRQRLIKCLLFLAFGWSILSIVISHPF